MNKQTSQIKKLTTTNYKNLNQKQGIELQPLNILIGANGSGKTNLISVLNFLKDCLTPVDSSRGMTAYEQAVINQLGGSKLLDGNLAYPANATYLFEFTHSETLLSTTLKITLHAKDAITTPFIVEESFEPFYRCHHKQSGIGIVSIDNPTQKDTHFEEITGVPTNELTLLAIPKLLEDSHFAPEKAPIYKARRRLLESISQWRFYNANDMSLKAIRDTYPKIGANDIFLSATCENLPLVLDNIMQHPTYGIDFE
ncbi:MAG: AAA family ATPase [Pseudomonadota bacterium]